LPRTATRREMTALKVNHGEGSRARAVWPHTRRRRRANVFLIHAYACSGQKFGEPLNGNRIPGTLITFTCAQPYGTPGKRKSQACESQRKMGPEVTRRPRDGTRGSNRKGPATGSPPVAGSEGYDARPRPARHGFESRRTSQRDLRNRIDQFSAGRP